MVLFSSFPKQDKFSLETKVKETDQFPRQKIGYISQFNTISLCFYTRVQVLIFL